MYQGEADWSYLNLVKANPRLTSPVLGMGNTDFSPEKALEYKKYNTMSMEMMIGRARCYLGILMIIKHFLATGRKIAYSWTGGAIVGR